VLSQVRSLGTVDGGVSFSAVEVTGHAGGVPPSAFAVSVSPDGIDFLYSIQYTIISYEIVGGNPAALTNPTFGLTADQSE